MKKEKKEINKTGKMKTLLLAGLMALGVGKTQATTTQKAPSNSKTPDTETSIAKTTTNNDNTYIYGSNKNNKPSGYTMVDFLFDIENRGLSGEYVAFSESKSSSMRIEDGIMKSISSFSAIYYGDNGIAMATEEGTASFIDNKFQIGTRNKTRDMNEDEIASFLTALTPHTERASDEFKRNLTNAMGAYVKIKYPDRYEDIKEESRKLTTDQNSSKLTTAQKNTVNPSLIKRQNSR